LQQLGTSRWQQIEVVLINLFNGSQPASSQSTQRCHGMQPPVCNCCKGSDDLVLELLPRLLLLLLLLYGRRKLPV
jgi:hypothetical protein